MKLISGPTFFYRRLFPVFFIVLVFFIGFMAITNFNLVHKFLYCIFCVILLALYYYQVYRKQKIITAVYDMDDRLLFCGKDCEQYVFISDLISIDYSRVQFDERLIIKTKKSGCFGSVLSFNLPVRLSMPAENPILTDLKERMIKCRRNTS